MSPKQSLADAVRLAIELGPHIARSGFHGCANESQGVTICFMAFQAGLPIEHYMREYHIVAKTRLEMRSDAMLKNFRERGGDWTVLRRDSEVAEAEFSYLGKKQKFAATWAEISQEPYVSVTDKDGKTKIREKYATPRSRMQMLWARLISDSLRVIAPEIVAGYYAPEDFGEVDGDAAEELAEVAPRATVGQVVSASAKTEPAFTPEQQKAIVDAVLVKDAPAAEAKPAGDVLDRTSAMGRVPVDQPTVDAIRSLAKELGCGAPIVNRLSQFGMKGVADMAMADAKALLQNLQSQKQLGDWIDRVLEPPGN